MKIKVFILFALSLLSALNACKKNNTHAEEEKKVKAMPVIVREIPDEANGFGNLSFLSKIDIVSPHEAVIKKLYFREGDFVNQGTLIIQLENPQIVLAAERARNNYSQALAARNLSDSRLLEGIFQSEAQLLALEKSEAELELMKKRWEETQRKHLNQETLFEAGGIHTEAILVSRFTLNSEWEQIQLMEKELQIRRIGSRDQDLVKAGIPVPLDQTERTNALVNLMTSGLRAELEAAQARLEAAEKELASADFALSQLTIYSPASGIIGVRYLEEGERAQSQDKIISLIDTASLYAIFPVRERDALRIKKGMPASVLIDGTGNIQEGFVDLVYPQADSQSLSFLVRVLLENTNGELNNLKPGMFARVAVTLGPARKAVFVPETSIINLTENEGSVFIINGRSLSLRKIIPGSLYGEDREIISGLNPGDIIVRHPGSDLREGTNVALIE